MKTAIGGLAIAALIALIELPHAQETTASRAPFTGENSFTEAQAKAWLENLGYTHIGHLVLGTDGIWRASARLNGIPTLVTVDYKGNVTSL